MKISLKEVTVLILSIVVVCGFMVDAYLILSGKLDTSDPSHASLIGQTIGYLQGAASMILAYYFSSTKESENKNVTIAAAVDKIPTPPSTQTITATTTNEKEKTP